MNCQNCQEQLSQYIDGELDEKFAAEVKTHLGLCRECADLHEDFAGILLMCENKGVTEESAPPNPQAMWCRINNVIESEIKPELPKETPRGSWAFSFRQIATAVVGIAIISSLITFVGLKNADNQGEVSAKSNPPTLFQRAMSKIGLAETPQQARERRFNEQQTAIEYWNKRVEARRAQWDASLRNAFDRNLREINQVVSEYTQILEANPQDELSGEMLDSALIEKMDLLREFSDL